MIDNSFCHSFYVKKRSDKLILVFLNKKLYIYFTSEESPWFSKHVVRMTFKLVVNLIFLIFLNTSRMIMFFIWLIPTNFIVYNLGGTSRHLTYSFSTILVILNQILKFVE